MIVCAVCTVLSLTMVGAVVIGIVEPVEKVHVGDEQVEQTAQLLRDHTVLAEGNLLEGDIDIPL